MVLRNLDEPVFSTNTPPSRETVHAQIAAMGKELDPEKFDQAYERLYDLFELRGNIFVQEIEAIAEEILLTPQIEWDLVSLKTTIGPNVLPTATVVLNSPDDRQITSQAGGYSSADAIYSAIGEATGIRIFLKHFDYNIISSGLNSLGQASITVEYHNRQVRAKACSIDMLEAAAKVYLMAINIVLDRINQQLD
ncbi:MAG: alpha-isopropylmalate synthase regulatory domain-containing protein [Phycisphaerae bacterium]|nr:alpha-isopropylmalate synthase regulatory domain-containing protein [Phycisphaerae bacterium]